MNNRADEFPAIADSGRLLSAAGYRLRLGWRRLTLRTRRAADWAEAQRFWAAAHSGTAQVSPAATVARRTAPRSRVVGPSAEGGDSASPATWPSGPKPPSFVEWAISREGMAFCLWQSVRDHRPRSTPQSLARRLGRSSPAVWEAVERALFDTDGLPLAGHNGLASSQRGGRNAASCCGGAAERAAATADVCVDWRWLVGWFFREHGLTPEELGRFTLDQIAACLPAVESRCDTVRMTAGEARAFLAGLRRASDASPVCGMSGAAATPTAGHRSRVESAAAGSPASPADQPLPEDETPHRCDAPHHRDTRKHDDKPLQHETPLKSAGCPESAGPAALERARRLTRFVADVQRLAHGDSQARERATRSTHFAAGPADTRRRGGAAALERWLARTEPLVERLERLARQDPARQSLLAESGPPLVGRRLGRAAFESTSTFQHD